MSSHSSEPPRPATRTVVASMGEEAHLAPRDSEALVRLVETAPVVSRRPQFFVWSQGPLHSLLPHSVLVCGAYLRQTRSMMFNAFQTVVLPADTLEPLTNASSPLLRTCAAEWSRGGARPLVLEPAQLMGDAQAQALQLQHSLGNLQLVVHGVSRPQRASELESLFVFVAPSPEPRPGERALHAELLMPYLHATWRRVLGHDAEPGVPTGATTGASSAGLPANPDLRGAPSQGAAPMLTGREREILLWAREGKSNLQIGEVLGISALTVKNHIQKILRKLGARNRAQAVALAMTQALLQPGPGPGTDGR